MTKKQIAFWMLILRIAGASVVLIVPASLLLTLWLPEQYAKLLPTVVVLPFAVIIYVSMKISTLIYLKDNKADGEYDRKL